MGHYETSVFGDIEKEKKITTMKLYFSKDVDIKKVLLSSKISSREKNYKCFLGYCYNDLKVKPLHIILPKTRAYKKSDAGQTK